MTQPQDSSLEDLVRQRPNLRGLLDGPELSLSPNYRGPCVQSDYAKLHLQNAADLLVGSHHLDFAVPGTLFLLRQGLELWIKCIVSNFQLDEILARIIRDRPAFQLLADSELVTGGRPKHVANKNRAALSRGLCAFRNREVEGMRAPDIWTKRNQGNFPDQAIVAVAERADFSRELFGQFYLPLIGCHELRKPWVTAREQVAERSRDINSFGVECGSNVPLDLQRFDDLVELLSHLDPDGDALRYPFSAGMKWHNDMPPMSRAWLGQTISQIIPQLDNERGERSQRYSLSTIGGGFDPWILSQVDESD